MKNKNHSHQSRNVLEQGQLKATPGRLALLDIFSHAKKPLSAKDLLGMFKKSEIDKVTIYRTIESLVELGIIKQIRLKDRQAYYELSARGHHHHVVCGNCGRVKDMSGCGLDFVNKKFLKASGFASISEHSLEFFGICAACAKS